MGPVDVRNLVSGDSLSVKEGSTLNDLFTIIGIREEHKKFVIAMVNDRKATIYQTLKDNDTLKLMLPVGGG
jgi:sulfur carrier protein ThiS